MGKNIVGVSKAAFSSISQVKFDRKRPNLGSDTMGKEQEERFKARAKYNFSPSQKVSREHASSHPCSSVPKFTPFSKIPPFSIRSCVTLYLPSRYPNPTRSTTSHQLGRPLPASEQCISSSLGVGP